MHHGVVFGVRHEVRIDAGFAVRPQHLDDQHRVVRRKRPAALGDEDGMRHLFSVAHFLNGVNDRVGVLLERIVDAVLAPAVGHLVAHAQPAPDVQVADPYAAPVELRIDLRDLLDGLLERLDVGDLAAQVEVEQVQRIGLAVGFEALDEAEQFGNRDAELGAVAAGGRPLPRAARGQVDAHAQPRPDVQLGGQPHQPLELVVLFHHRNDRLAKLLPRQDQPEHDGVFVAVADQQRLVRLDVRQRRHELCLRATLQAQTVRTSGLHHLLNNLVKLIHLDRVDAVVAALVPKLLDSLSEGLVELHHASPQDVLETDEHGESRLWREVLHDPMQIDGLDVPVRIRTSSNVTALVHGKVAVRPGVDVVQGFGILGRPGGSVFRSRCFGCGNQRRMS